MTKPLAITLPLDVVERLVRLARGPSSQYECIPFSNPHDLAAVETAEREVEHVRRMAEEQANQPRSKREQYRYLRRSLNRPG